MDTFKEGVSMDTVNKKKTVGYSTRDNNLVEGAELLLLE